MLEWNEVKKMMKIDLWKIFLHVTHSPIHTYIYTHTHIFSMYFLNIDPYLLFFSFNDKKTIFKFFCIFSCFLILIVAVFPYLFSINFVFCVLSKKKVLFIVVNRELDSLWLVSGIWMLKSHINKFVLSQNYIRSFQ